MKNIQMRIDEILITEMGTDGYMNSEQEEVLKNQLLKDGYEPSEVYGAIKHYNGL